MHLKNYFPNQAPRNVIRNWTDHYINPYLYYAHRTTDYQRGLYPSGLHFHDYYEIVIVVDGSIRFECENETCLPERGDVILIPPHRLHISLLDAEETRYDRYKFYLYENALEQLGGTALLDFIHRCEGHHVYYSLQQALVERMLGLFRMLDDALQAEQPADHALANGLLLQIFYILNIPSEKSVVAKTMLPPKALKLQNYLDKHFAEFTSVSNLADSFYYSREYVSRLFKKHFHITINDYVTKLRVSHSQHLMAADFSLTDICFQSGFGSLSAFNRAFHKETGMTPSAYRAKLQSRNSK